MILSYNAFSFLEFKLKYLFPLNFLMSLLKNMQACSWQSWIMDQVANEASALESQCARGLQSLRTCCPKLEKEAEPDRI